MNQPHSEPAHLSPVNQGFGGAHAKAMSNQLRKANFELGNDVSNYESIA
jgi:hypothetical protein